jgi:hypothetical protein
MQRNSLGRECAHLLSRRAANLAPIGRATCCARHGGPPGLAEKRQARGSGTAQNNSLIEHGDEQQEEMMFDGFDPCQYEDEARERWGRTDAYTEAARRVASYGEAEWREIKAQAQDIERLFAGLKRSGQPADGEPARAAAEQARLHIDRSFIPARARCTGRSARCTSQTRDLR